MFGETEQPKKQASLSPGVVSLPQSPREAGRWPRGLSPGAAFPDPLAAAAGGALTRGGGRETSSPGKLRPRESEARRASVRRLPGFGRCDAACGVGAGGREPGADLQRPSAPRWVFARAGSHWGGRQGSGAERELRSGRRRRRASGMGHRGGSFPPRSAAQPAARPLRGGRL